MTIAVQVNDIRERPRVAWGVVAAMAAAILVVLGLELVAPHDLTLGALVLVVVVVAALVLDTRKALAIVAVAVVSRAVTAGVGDISVGQAALEMATFVVAASVALACRRSWDQVPKAVKAGDDAIEPKAQTAFSLQRIAESALTGRERQVLQMAMQGLTAGQVAERLFISKRTVETHLERAYAKLGVRSKRELIASAFDQARSAES